MKPSSSSSETTMNLDRTLTTRPAVILAAFAVALALSSCGRALPMSPDTSLAPNHGNTTPNALVVNDGGDNSGAPGGPGGSDPGVSDGGGDNPVPLGPPATGNLGGLPQTYTRVANRLVKTNKDVVVAGGHWSMTFHNGSMSVKKVASVDQALDGTLRADLSPSGMHFGTAVDLVVDYTGSHMDPSAPGYVAGSVPMLMWWDGVARKWVVVASTNDAVNHKLHAQLSQLGVYGVSNGSGW
jgi:hypothetical protein